MRVPCTGAVCPECRWRQPELTVVHWRAEQRAAKRLPGDLQPLNDSPLLQNSLFNRQTSWVKGSLETELMG